jgi:carboxylate-amine ligase
LGSTAALQQIFQKLRDGSDASYLRREHTSRGSVEGIVDAALQRFRPDNDLVAPM